jgi:hypothetical protein
MTDVVHVEVISPTGGELPEVVRQAWPGLTLRATWFEPNPQDKWQGNDPPGYVVLAKDAYAALIASEKHEAAAALLAHPVSPVTRLRFPPEVCRVLD